MGDQIETAACNQTPCSYYGAWSNWSACSVSCGIGSMTRTRYCHGGEDGTGLWSRAKKVSENSTRRLVIWDNAANGPGLAGPAVVIHLKSRKISVSELRVTNAQMNHGNSNKSSAKFHQSRTPPTLSSLTAEPLSSTLKLQSPQDNRLNSTISSILTRSKLK